VSTPTLVERSQGTLHHKCFIQSPWQIQSTCLKRVVPYPSEHTGILDRRRISDDRCPNGFKERDDKKAPVKFRLSDIYTYSEAIMNSAVQTNQLASLS
jgi:hypothetical protein